jgi:hypothetical protein
MVLLWGTIIYLKGLRKTTKNLVRVASDVAKIEICYKSEILLSELTYFRGQFLIDVKF